GWFGSQHAFPAFLQFFNPRPYQLPFNNEARRLALIVDRDFKHHRFFSPFTLSPRASPANKLWRRSLVTRRCGAARRVAGMPLITAHRSALGYTAEDQAHCSRAMNVNSAPRP